MNLVREWLQWASYSVGTWCIKLGANFLLVQRIRRCGSVSPPPIHPHGSLAQSNAISGLEMNIYNKYMKMLGCKMDIILKNGIGIFRID